MEDHEHDGTGCYSCKCAASDTMRGNPLSSIMSAAEDYYQFIIKDA